MRKGLTLIELLVVLSIIAVILFFCFRGCSGGPTGKSWGETITHYKARCVKTYTVVVFEDASSKRVDLKTESGERITVTCDDDIFNGINNSATFYSQFEDDHWYQVSTIGWRDEFWSRFPNVKSVREIPVPE